MYVSLHNQTEYSILDSACSVKDLFAKAKELEMPAIAITDHSSFASIYDAYKESQKTKVKLIVGCEYNYSENKTDSISHVILLAKNLVGFQNMLQLNFEAYQNGIEGSKKIFPIVNFDLLSKYSEGTICLTACGNGILSQVIMNKNKELTKQRLDKLKQIFKDDLYIEIQANNLKRFSNGYLNAIDQVFINRQLIKLAKENNVKVVPSSNTHYVNKGENKIHDTLLAIGAHQNVYSNYRLKYEDDEFYLKSENEIISFFSRNYTEEFAKEIVNNTIEINEKCESPEWIFPKYTNESGKELPEFDVKSQPDYREFEIWLSNQDEKIKSKQEDVQYLRFRTFKFLPNRLSKISTKDMPKYLNQIEIDLDTFEYCNISSYMLIVADYIDFCRQNDIPFGPGRGSTGGSIVNYILGIHNADPLKYGLVLERFHNKKKKAVSDIDADFSQKERHYVLDYISRKYGKSNVAHVSNLIKLTPKVYVRDITRAHDLGGSQEESVELGNKIADSISSEIHSIDQALNEAPIFCEYAKKYKQLIENKSLCNKPRAFGTHAAGIIIGKRQLSKIAPLRMDKDGSVALEMDKELAEENGLIKMDILGLSTLDIIKRTRELIALSGKDLPEVDVEEYDEKTYDLISSGNTMCVFQFGTSAGTIDLCKKLKPKSIEDLAAITTLARPASKDIRENYILTKLGKKQPELLHPSLKNALEATYCFPLYDESLLILAKDVAGWELDEADKLRKLTKEKGKNPQKAKQWEEEFVDGAIKNGLSKEDAQKIWDKIVSPYGKYSFNKAHAVLYSMISFETAYYKAHFPVEFLIANLMQELESNAPDSEENVAKIKQEIRSYGVKILPPDINNSSMEYVLDENNNLITGLKGIKFVGDDAIQSIIALRPFNSFKDFMARVDSSLVRANAIQALAASGAFDSFRITRKNIWKYCSDYRKTLTNWKKKHSINDEFSYKFENVQDEWNVDELYALEKHFMGEAFICTPAKAYKSFFSNQYMLVNQIKKIQDKSKIKSFKCILNDFVELTIKKETSKFFGKTMVKAIVEDSSRNTISLTIFPDRWEDLIKKMAQAKIKFEPGIAMHISCTSNIYEDEVGIIYDGIYEVSNYPQLPKDIKEKKKANNKSLSIEESIIQELKDLSIIDDSKDYD